MENALVFAIRSQAALGGDIAWAGGFAPGAVDVHVFPDGEIQQTVKTPAAGRDACLVADTAGEGDTLEAFDLACALVAQGARSLSLAIPFFGYSTMERASHPGEAVTAKSRALLWSALPRAPHGNRILILEPHTAGLPHYFGPGNLVAGLDAFSLMLDMLERLPKEGSVLCSPDIGRIKWVDSLAAASGRPAAFVLKRRSPGRSVQAFALSGEVEGRRVILCDDMIRTGDTLRRAAEACRESGARDVFAVAVHGAFVPGALEALRDSGLFRSLICTDSHPAARRQAPGWLETVSCAGLMARSLSAPWI